MGRPALKILGLQLVCGRPILALRSALVSQALSCLVWFGRSVFRNLFSDFRFLILNVILRSKKLFKIYFYFTAAGVVPCGNRKKPPRTSSIVQIIFYFNPLRSEDIF